MAVRYKGRSVVGFGIGGDEAKAGPELFREVYAYAAENGLRLTAHAGETAGPESVWGALNLRAERIGHGLTAWHDPDLVEELSTAADPSGNLHDQQSAHGSVFDDGGASGAALL